MDVKAAEKGREIGADTYDRMFDRLLGQGRSPTDAAVAVAEAYLDGRPSTRGKHRVSAAGRDAAFWASAFPLSLPAQAWGAEPMVLAFARYFGQQGTSNPALVAAIAPLAPDALRLAVRRSGLVLNQTSPRFGEFRQIAEESPGEFGELADVFAKFDEAYRQRLELVERCKIPLADLTPLELLAYASLHAFEVLVPRDLLGTPRPIDPDEQTQTAWDAINDLLAWKLATATDGMLAPSEADIGRSLALHLSPFLFPSADGPRPREDLRNAFADLLAAQIELNSFVSRSAEPFCHDDGIRFVLREGRLEIVETDPQQRAKWERDGEKLARLHMYWLYRALEAFAASEAATMVIGKPENHEANRFAYIKALRTQLQLTEVYGLDESVRADTGLRVGVFQALLAMELMSAFFMVDFLQPYLRNLKRTGVWRSALGQLALAGLMQPGWHIRFPLTWSDRNAKIANITGWTVSKEFPRGHAKAAEAILDFWTSDWAALARQLRERPNGMRPELFERPIFKMGRYLFQLPWLVGMQNNATAAIGNLRRLGGRRAEARDETRRIEQRLARCFEGRGFRVAANYQPPRQAEDDPGEVDLICAGEGVLLVIEVKSTFLRRSGKDAWLHGTTTLRKAGLQLRRKLGTIEAALRLDAAFAGALGLDARVPPPAARGWIVDTSIEHDHERFSGFLKVSIEDVLIALRDDRHLLDDPFGFASGRGMEMLAGDLTGVNKKRTLYPDGFTALRFVEVVEGEAVWQ